MIPALSAPLWRTRRGGHRRSALREASSGMFADTVSRLERALARPLPGAPAQQHMMPRPPRDWPPRFNRARIRDAAGLLLLFPCENRSHLVLTVRAGTLERHGGQVSLPGG